MSPAACFRCDWQGETSNEICPRCGTHLYRGEPRRAADPAPVTAPPAPVTAPPTPRAEPSPPAEQPSQRTHPIRRTARSAGALVALLLTIAAIALVGGRLTGSPRRAVHAREPARRPPTLGTLVYAAAGHDGRQRLWRLDLASGEVRVGPTIPVATALHPATAAGPDWIGVDAADGTGRVQVLLLQGTGPAVEPRLLGRGDLVAWGPLGATVAIARRSSEPGHPCGRLVVSVIGVQMGLGGRVFDTNACEDLVALGRDQVITYLELVRDGRPSLSYVGLSAVPHRLLHGYEMVSASPSADFVVTRGRGSGPGAALFWRGRGSPVPLGDDRGPLIVRSVPAWSLDGARALVMGRLGDRRGLFEIVAGPGGEGDRRVPTFVRPASGDVAAAYAEDGTAYLAVRGRLLRYADGMVAEVPLPVGAPPPAGPIVWVP